MNKLNLHLFSLVMFILVLFGSASSVYGQAWTSANGKFKVEAEFVQIKDGKVELKREGNGKIIKVALKDLSEDDQKRAKKLQKAAEKDAASDKKTGKSKLLEGLDFKCEASRAETASFGSADDADDEPVPVVVKITATGDAAGSAVQYGMLDVKSFTDGKGNALEQDEDQFSMHDTTTSMAKIDRESGFFASHPKNGVGFEIQIPAEVQPEKIGQLSGSFMLLTGGTRSTESFKDLSKLYGKVLKSNALRNAGLKVKVEKPEGDDSGFGLSFTVTGKMKMLNRLYIGDSNEQELGSQNGHSTSTFNNQTTYSFFYPGDVSDEAILYIEMVEGAFELKVPFEFRDIEVTDSN